MTSGKPAKVLTTEWIVGERLETSSAEAMEDEFQRRNVTLQHVSTGTIGFFIFNMLILIFIICWYILHI